MLKRSILLLLLAAPAVLFAQGPKKLPLDGRKFKTELIEDGKKKPLDEEELTFNMGKFKSSLFSDPSWGFTKGGKYEITRDSTTSDGVKIYSWVAELTNESEEKLSWSGMVNGDNIDGTMEFINKKGQVKRTYSFTGEVKKKAGQKQ